MSDHTDESTRPAKRARLDDNTAPSLSTDTTSAQAPQASPKAPVPTANDSDLEREVRAGITEYICPDNLGFTGVLKQRYTDFLVNEITLDGRVLHLTSTEVGEKANKQQKRKVANGGEAKKTGEKDVKVEVKEETGAETLTVESAASAAQGAKIEIFTDEQAFNAANKASDQQESVKKEPEEEQLPEEDRDTLHSIFGEETTDQILTLVRQVRKREDKKAKDFKAVTSPPITDKETRTQAHKCLRRIFPNLLESVMEEDQSIRIKAAPPADRKGKKGKSGNQDRSGPARNRGQASWEELGGEYLHFSLYKENKDTMEVVGFLGSKLSCGTKGFGFAGTKDRRACTVQRLWVKRQTAERMHGFNKALYNAAIGDFEYRNDYLKLGDLMGNEFTITLRDCHFQNEEGLDFAQRYDLANQVLGKAVTDFSEKGFINYYGLQRFGSFAASTDAIGRKMLQDDLQGAVEDLLAYSDVALAAAQGTLTDSQILVSQDDRNRAKALHIWKTQGSGSAALDVLPRKFTAERNIIQHLSSRNSKTGRHDRRTDWQGALMTIPRTLRLMYVHAYQSLVWNVVAGKRWATHGDNVVEGDLVLVSEHRDKQTTTATNGNNDEAMKAVVEDQDGEAIINPSGTENANASASDFERARPLSAAEASSGAYTIWDIVLPQPGYDVEYPGNSIGAFYKEFMGSEKGGHLDPYDMRRSWREVSLSGGYRKFRAKPMREVTWRVERYRKVDEQFVETDLQRLRAGKGGCRGVGRDVDVGMEDVADGRDGKGEDGGEDGEMGEEKKLAVVITLQLASSQYATMALRELMKAGGVKAFKAEYLGGR